MNTSATPREGSHAARDLLRHGPSEASPVSKRSSEKRAFGWLNIRPLWASRNDILARVLDDPTNALRERWIRWLVHKGRTDNPTIGTHANCDEVTVVIVGDPGEGDCSQDVVIPPLLAIQKDADFLVVCSDVVYPAGDVNEYAEKFYAPQIGPSRSTRFRATTTGTTSLRASCSIFVASLRRPRGGVITRHAPCCGASRGHGSLKLKSAVPAGRSAGAPFSLHRTL